MLVGIFGNLGSAKTLTLTMLSWLYKNVKRAYVACNYRNECADLVLSAEELLMQISELGKEFPNRPKALFLDELGRILTATDWYTDVNTILGKIFTESRKRGFDIIYTSQSAMMVDRNVRRITDIVLLPQYNEKSTKVTVETYEMRGLFWVPDDDLKFEGRKYFDVYDTNEIIEPNKQAIVNYYSNKLQQDKDLYYRLGLITNKKDRLDYLSFHLNIKLKLAKLILIDIQQQRAVV